MMALFDSHCHVDEPKFDDDREDVLTRMAEAGVTRYAVIGSDMATSRHSADFAAAHPGCYAAIGIHPHEAKGFVEDDGQWYELNAAAAGLTAAPIPQGQQVLIVIGEGLDKARLEKDLRR